MCGRYRLWLEEGGRASLQWQQLGKKGNKRHALSLDASLAVAPPPASTTAAALAKRTVSLSGAAGDASFTLGSPQQAAQLRSCLGIVLDAAYPSRRPQLPRPSAAARSDLHRGPAATKNPIVAKSSKL